MKNVISFSKRDNSFIEIARLLLLFFLIIGHSGYVLVYAGYAEGDFANFVDSKIFFNLSEGMTVGFAAITGLYVFNNNNLALRNFIRILYIIVINAVLSSVILAAVGKAIDGEVICWLLTGSRDSWYLYSVLLLYAVAPFIHKLFGTKDFLYLIFGLFMIVPIYYRALPGPFGAEGKTTMWLLSTAFMSRYFSRKSFIYTYIYLLVFTACLSIKICIPIFEDEFQVVTSSEVFTRLWPASTLIMWVTLMSILYRFKWRSKTINYVVSNAYFVYEFHYLVQLIFAKWIFDYNDLHAMFYYQMIFCFSLPFMFSFPATWIYRKYWIPHVQPKILNMFNRFKFVDQEKQS